MIEELTRLHRGTALHIQRQLSARPRAGNFVAEPLDFLHKPPFLPYVDRNIEERIEEEVMKQVSSSRGELTTFPEPLAILSESGSGKSILVARLAQRLMTTTNANPERGILVLFAQLKNAQGSSLLEEICSSVGLGRSSTVDELRSFLPEGLRSHRLILLIDSLDESQHRFSWPVVDESLRTPPEKTESDGLNDVLPIWVSRRHDWRAFSPEHHQDQQGLLKGESLQLDISVDESISEMLHHLVEERHQTSSKQPGKNSVSSIRNPEHIVQTRARFLVHQRIEYLEWALTHYQILHLPRTIHSEPETAIAFFQRVMNAALDHLDALVEAHEEVEWDYLFPEQWKENIDWLATARTNLAYALLSATVEEAVSRVPPERQGEAQEAINTLLDEFSNHALESLEDRGEMSDALPRHLSSENVHLLSALSDLGVVLRSDHDALHYRWAHRDLTAMSMLAHSLNQSTEKKFRDIVARAEKQGWGLVLTNAPGYGRKSSGQFHRKSGRSLLYTDPGRWLFDLEEEIGIQTNGTPWEGLTDYGYFFDKFRQLLQAEMELSKAQSSDDERWRSFIQISPRYGAFKKEKSYPNFDSLRKWLNKSNVEQGNAFTAEQAVILAQAPPHAPLILKGPPGTGKTWLGTEVLLGHAKAWNAQAWIITLNSHLAEEIEATIAENHERGPLHRSIRRAYDSDVEADTAFKDIVERRVQVFDIQSIMRDLALALDFKDPTILTDASLRRRFEAGFLEDPAVKKVMRSENITPVSLWPRALRDYKNAMFLVQEGRLRTVDEYHRHCKEHKRSQGDSLYPYGIEVMRAWYRIIAKAIGKLVLPPQYVVGTLLKRISEQGLDYLQRTIQRLEGMMDTLRPESILIDEIQDLSVSEVLALMLLTRLSAPQANRAILVGDQFQSLNGNRFRWETWLNDLGHLAREILENNTSEFPDDHVLHALASLGEKNGEELTTNMRSDPEIVSLVRAAWAWTEDKKHEQNEAAVELQAMDTDENDRTVVHHIPEDEQLTEYVLKVLEEATQYIELSVLAVDHGLADALRERLRRGDISSSVRMTTVYDPTMIKGLERDAVLVIGPFMASNKGEFPLLFYSNTDDTSTEEAQLHRLNQHVHVALSRAKLASTILTYKPRSDGGSQVIEDPKNKIRLRQYPNPIDAWRLEDEAKRTATTIEEATANLSVYSEEELEALRPFIRLNEIAQENRRAKVDAGLEGQMERVRDAFIDEFGALDSAHPFCAGLLHLVHQENIAVGASSIIHSLIGKSGSTTTKDVYGRAHRRAKHPDGQKLTPDELHATVEYWYEAMRHQKAILRLKFGHNSIEEHLQEGIQEKAVAKLRTHRDELLERALDVIRDDIKALYPDYLKRFIAMGERSDSEALAPDMLLAHLLNRAKSVDFSALSSAGADADALKPHWASTLALVLREHDKNRPSAMSFLRGLSDPSAKAWVASEPTVEAYLQHIMMGKIIQENDSLEPVIAAATNLRKWKYQHADAPSLPRWFTRSFAALLNVSDSPKRSNYPDQSQNLLRYFDAGTYHHNGHHHRNNADTLRAIGESFLTGSDVTPQTIPQGLVLFAQLWKRVIPSSAGDDDPAVVNAFVEAGSAWYRTFTRLLGKVLDSMSTPYFAHRPIEWHLYTYLPAIMKTDMPLVLDWAKNHEPSVQAMHSNDAELLAVLIPILKQHNEYRRSGKGSAVIGHRDSNRMKLFDDIEFSFPTPNSKPGAAENRGATASPILQLLSPHLRKLIEIKLSEEKPPKRIDVQGKHLRATDLLPRRGLYGLPTAVALPTGRVMSDWLESGRPAKDSAGETLTAWMTTSRLLLPPAARDGYESELRFQWHEVEHPSEQINTNADLFRFLYSEPSHVREFTHTDQEGMSQKMLLLVVNPLDRIGAFAEKHLRGLSFEYVDVSDTVVHRALTSQLGLSPGTPLYNQLKNLALDTYGADVHPSHQQNMLNLDADDVDVAKFDKGLRALRSRLGGQVAPKTNVNLVFGPSITLFHRILMRRLELANEYTASGDLTRQLMETLTRSEIFTEEDGDEWVRLRDYAIRERGGRSAADPILAWMNDFGVSYSDDFRQWYYYPSLKFTWE